MAGADAACRSGGDGSQQGHDPSSQQEVGAVSESLEITVGSAASGYGFEAETVTEATVLSLDFGLEVACRDRLDADACNSRDNRSSAA